LDFYKNPIFLSPKLSPPPPEGGGVGVPEGEDWFLQTILPAQTP